MVVSGHSMGSHLIKRRAGITLYSDTEEKDTGTMEIASPHHEIMRLD